jgi:hypothetical protein
MKGKLLLLATLLLSSTSFAASFLGTYRCSGYDPYLNRDYTGTVTIEQQNTVYKMTMHYDTGESYNGTGGQYSEDLLSVVFQDKKDLTTVGLEQYHYLSDDKKQIGGFWVYLGKDKIGREICDRQESAPVLAPAPAKTETKELKRD